MTPQEVINASGLNGTWVPLYRDTLENGDGTINVDVSDYTQLIVTTAWPGLVYCAFRADISVAIASTHMTTHASLSIPANRLVPLAVPRGWNTDKIYFSMYQPSSGNPQPIWIVGM